MCSVLRSNPSRADDEGSAVVEFVLVGALIVVLATGLLQLALTLHVRNVLVSCASEGAHTAALADVGLDEGAERASQLAAAALGGKQVSAAAVHQSDGGGTIVEVTLTTSVPILGLWGAGSMSVSAHAIEEGDDA